MFNLDYHPTLRSVGSVIKRDLPILYKSVAMKETFNPDKTRIMTGFRRHKNLKEILSPAAFPTNKANKSYQIPAVKSVTRNATFAVTFYQKALPLLA